MKPYIVTLKELNEILPQIRNKARVCGRKSLRINVLERCRLFIKTPYKKTKESYIKDRSEWHIYIENEDRFRNFYDYIADDIELIVNYHRKDEVQLDENTIYKIQEFLVKNKYKG